MRIFLSRGGALGSLLKLAEVSHTEIQTIRHEICQRFHYNVVPLPNTGKVDREIQVHIVYMHTLDKGYNGRKMTYI